MSRIVHPHASSKVDVEHLHVPVCASHSIFHVLYSRLIQVTESVKMMVCGLTVTCKGNPPERVRCVTASTSVVILEVGTLKALSTWMVVTDILLDSEAPPTASIHV